MSHNGPNPDHPISRPPVTDPTVRVLMAFRDRYGWRSVPDAVLYRAPKLVKELGPCGAIERVLVDVPHPCD